MSPPLLDHPDRLAATLAQLPLMSPTQGCRLPGHDARDCRIDQKILLWHARAAMATNAAAHAHLARWQPEQHPDLWAGTVQDGVARGFSVALEEAIAIAGRKLDDPFAVALPEATVVTGAALRRRKEILVASGGARARFSRKLGLLFVEREQELHAANCLWFEARRDLGCLDHFVPDPSQRARLFSAQYLRPVELRESANATLLVLAGSLSRGRDGFACRLSLLGRANEATLALRLELHMPPLGWRLRARFFGLPRTAIHHHCTDVSETVPGPQGPWHAFTLVRACDRLICQASAIDVPGAGELRHVVHDFRLG